VLDELAVLEFPDVDHGHGDSGHPPGPLEHARLGANVSSFFGPFIESDAKPGKRKKWMVDRGRELPAVERRLGGAASPGWLLVVVIVVAAG